VKDFGYTTDAYDLIYPLNFNVSVKIVEGVLVFWCVDVSTADVPISEGTIRLFPILRMENYQSQSREYYNDQTVALVYTLGACYCFDLVLFVLFLMVMLKSVYKTKKEVPIVAWIALIFVILCIFRIVFCFLWPVGGFEDNPVAQYAVFEIPTFLLFSVVIIAIAFWRKLSRKSAFFFRETDRTLYAFVVFANFLVWSFFAIVIIVYAEKIIPENQPVNICPGRVAASNEQLANDTHELSVIYQAIVIFFTFTLGAIFYYMSYRLFKVTSKGVSSAKKFIFRIGAIIVSAFMLRCVLFIILLAVDFISDIYLFITLMITEVIMMFLVQMEFNKKFFMNLLSGASSVMPTGVNLSTGTQSSPIKSGEVRSESSSQSDNA